MGQWFNNRRLLERIGIILPADVEANFYAALDAKPMVAQLMKVSLRHTLGGSASGPQHLLPDIGRMIGHQPKV